MDYSNNTNLSYKDKQSTIRFIEACESLKIDEKIYKEGLDMEYYLKNMQKDLESFI